MKIDIYTCKDHRLTKKGHVITLYDRIVQVNFSGPGNPKRYGGKKTAYPFDIQRISKADLPFREFQLTHQLICHEVYPKSLTPIFIRLNWLQCCLIQYYNKQFFWQSKEFSNKMLFSMVKYMALAGSGALLVLVAPTVNTLRIENNPPELFTKTPVNTPLDSLSKGHVTKDNAAKE